MIKKILKKLGFTDEQITNITDPKKSKELKTEDVDTMLTGLEDSARENYIEVYKNSDEFEAEKDKIIKSLEGSTLGSLNNHMKKMGLDLVEIKDLPMAEKFKKLQEHVNSDKSDEVKELQQKNADLEKKNEDLEKTLPDKETELDNKFAQQKSLLKLDQHFAKIPDDRLFGVKDNKDNRNPITNLTKSTILDKYDFKEDSEGTLKVYNKGKDTQPQDGSNILGVDDVIKKQLMDSKYWVESNGSGSDDKDDDSKPKEFEMNKDFDKNKTVKDGVAAAQKRVEELTPTE